MDKLNIKSDKVYTSIGNKTSYKELTNLNIIIETNGKPVVYTLGELFEIFYKDIKNTLDELERDLG